MDKPFDFDLDVFDFDDANEALRQFKSTVDSIMADLLRKQCEVAVSEIMAPIYKDLGIEPPKTPEPNVSDVEVVSEEDVPGWPNCGADLDGDTFYYLRPNSGPALVMINHNEIWRDGYKAGYEKAIEDYSDHMNRFAHGEGWSPEMEENE